MSNVIIWTAGERLLYCMFIFFAITGGIKYLFNSRDSETKRQKDLMKAFTALGLLNGISHLFWFLSHFYFAGTYSNGYFIGMISDEISPAHELIFLGHVSFDLVYVVFMYYYERVFPRTKHVLTIDIEIGPRTLKPF